MSMIRFGRCARCGGACPVHYSYCAACEVGSLRLLTTIAQMLRKEEKLREIRFNVALWLRLFSIAWLILAVAPTLDHGTSVGKGLALGALAFFWLLAWAVSPSPWTRRGAR
jgi:hypothetical protein